MNARSLFAYSAAVLVVGCSSGAGPANPRVHTPTGLEDLTVPTDGFQLRSAGADIAPGEDVEYCEIGELPGDPSETYNVTSVELANAPYSHHFVAAVATPGTDADTALRAYDIGDKVKCNGANFEWPQDGLIGLASATTPYFSLSFPEGVGTVLSGGQRMVFDYHYVNTTEKTVRARSALNVHVVDGATIEHIATAFSFFNFTVDVPPGSAKSFTAECHFKDDLRVANVVRHTHEHGRDFSVWFSGGPKDGEHIWTSSDWKQDTLYQFDEPIVLKAGEGFRFQCDFENPNSQPLRYGITGKDEMCILAGWIWSASDTRQLSSENCDITWIDGDGIGHPASEAGGFPPASSQDASVCLAGVNLLGSSGVVAPGCGDCVCNACGTVILKCASDADCAALLQCMSSGCGTESECIQACATEIHDHSSATGMMQEVRSCITSGCSGCGPMGG